MNKAYARQYADNAEAEYASRILARNNFVDFITYTYPQYFPEPFHENLCENLESVLRGDTERLMIIAPPQHGKSEAVSVRFPPFWLAKNPSLPVMVCSYGASLANEKVGNAKDLLYSDAYHNLFPEMFRKPGKWSRKKWALVNYNSKIYSAGVRGPITGKGAGLGIIDDPVKSWEEAYNPNQREKVWEWWRTTFRTRIWENGRIIVIMTRWHEDDLAGRILNTSGEKWKVLRYPALAESQEDRDEYNRKYLPSAIGEPDPLGRMQGEPLAPRRFSVGALLALKSDVGPRAWGAEYQGTPKPLEGQMFKQEWIGELVDEFPREARFVRYWDKAATEGGGAATAGVLMSKTKEGLFYVIDVITGHWSSLQREAIIKQTAALDENKYGRVEIWIEVEPGSGGIDSARDTLRNLSGYLISLDRPTRSKEIRFESFARQAEAGNVRFVRSDKTWSYLDELLLFPNSTYKDQVDATSGAFKILNQSGWTRTPGG